MGQKVNPHGFRVGVIKDWDARWYADKKDFSRYLVEDTKIREFLKKECFNAGVSRIEIERKGDEKTTVTIHTARPGIIIGRQGSGIDALKKKLKQEFGRELFINVMEIKQPDCDAQLVAENIADQLQRRISFRRAMKQTMSRSMRMGAKGIRTMVAGRLGGAEIARVEHYHEGRIPLHTLRADIDYGFSEAVTTYGRIGVKVWIYKGEVFPVPRKPQTAEGGDE